MVVVVEDEVARVRGQFGGHRNPNGSISKVGWHLLTKFVLNDTAGAYKSMSRPGASILIKELARSIHPNQESNPRHQQTFPRHCLRLPSLLCNVVWPSAMINSLIMLEWQDISLSPHALSVSIDNYVPPTVCIFGRTTIFITAATATTNKSMVITIATETAFAKCQPHRT